MRRRPARRNAVDSPTHHLHPPLTGVTFALVAAALFGATTPLAKLLLGEGISPVRQ